MTKSQQPPERPGAGAKGAHSPPRETASDEQREPDTQDQSYMNTETGKGEMRSDED